MHGVYHGGASMACPGVVRHTGLGALHMGLPPTIPDPLSESLTSAVADALSRCGLAAELRGDMDAVVWEKLAVNAAINPLSAILGVKNGFLARSEACREIMQGLSCHFLLWTLSLQSWERRAIAQLWFRFLMFGWLVGW